jgi:hypothetical protein
MQLSGFYALPEFDDVIAVTILRVLYTILYPAFFNLKIICSVS